MNTYNYINVKIKTTSPNKIIKLLRTLNINLYNIIIEKNLIILKIKYKDLEKVSKYYKFEITGMYGISYIKHYFKKIISNSIFITLFLIMIFILSNIIVRINIKSEDTNIKKSILSYLENKNIKPYKIAIPEDKLTKLKNEIQKDLSNIIEWINISRKGMVYEIEYQEKKEAIKIEKSDKCNIIAKKDGIISRIIAENGESIVDVNDSVKKDQILITGDIKLNEEIKSTICATGKVFAKTWYTINITLPKTYEEIEEKNKSRYNILLSHNNKNTKLFKDRLENFITNQKRIINIFGYEIFLLKDIETTTKINNYTEKELEIKLNELVKEHLKTVIGDEGKIIKQKVLKKEEKDSKIDIELFIVAEENISTSSSF